MRSPLLAGMWKQENRESALLNEATVSPSLIICSMLMCASGKPARVHSSSGWPGRGCAPRQRLSTNFTWHARKTASTCLRITVSATAASAWMSRQAFRLDPGGADLRQSPNSYRHLLPHYWSSAYSAWGFDKREAVVHVPSTAWGQEAPSINMELKCSERFTHFYGDPKHSG